MATTFTAMKDAAKKHGNTFSFEQWGIMAKSRQELFETGGKDCKAFMKTLVANGLLPDFMEDDREVVSVLWEEFCVPFVVEGLRRKAANQNHQVCNELEGKRSTKTNEGATVAGKAIANTVFAHFC